MTSRLECGGPFPDDHVVIERSPIVRHGCSTIPVFEAPPEHANGEQFKPALTYTDWLAKQPAHVRKAITGHA